MIEQSASYGLGCRPNISAAAAIQLTPRRERGTEDRDEGGRRVRFTPENERPVVETAVETAAEIGRRVDRHQALSLAAVVGSG